MKYTIDTLAKLANVTTRTLRYYDSIGLLKAKRDKQSNYRYYETEEVDRLQKILFLKELDIPLKNIADYLATSKEQEVAILEQHLMQVEQEQMRLDQLKKNIQKTIAYQKGETNMQDKEKFIGLKNRLLEENEKKHREEVVNRWGEESYESAKSYFKNMSESEFAHYQQLGRDIIQSLLIAFQNGNDPASRESQHAAKLHQEWIQLSLGSYNTEIHLNLVDMYLSDERFKQYYDQHQEGLTKLLHDAVYHYLMQ